MNNFIKIKIYSSIEAMSDSTCPLIIYIFRPRERAAELEKAPATLTQINFPLLSLYNHNRVYDT